MKNNNNPDGSTKEHFGITDLDWNQLPPPKINSSIINESNQNLLVQWLQKSDYPKQMAGLSTPKIVTVFWQKIAISQWSSSTELPQKNRLS